MGTAIVLVVLIAVVICVVRSLVRAKKSGKSPLCGGDCKNCRGCHR